MTQHIPVCKHCGQPIPPQRWVGDGTKANRIYEFIAKHPEGVSRAEVADYVYADHHDGGPEHSLTCISTAINQMNRSLAKSGLQIKSSRGHGARYRLIRR